MIEVSTMDHKSRTKGKKSPKQKQKQKLNTI
jgi:hypothetical protein